MNESERRGRGRPRGPSEKLLKTDLPLLVAAADIVLATRLAPTTAFRRVSPGIGDSRVRRLQQRWKERGSQLLADAKARHASLQLARSDALSAAAASASPWLNPRVMAELLGNSPWTNSRVMADLLGNSPWTNPALMKAITGGSALDYSAAAKAASFSQLGLPAVYSMAAKAAGPLALLNGLTNSPLKSALDALGTSGPVSGAMASLRLLQGIGTPSTFDAIMGRTRRKD